MPTTAVRLIASVALAALPLSAFAQTASAYTPPKLVKAGESATPVPGPGIVAAPAPSLGEVIRSMGAKV